MTMSSKSKIQIRVRPFRRSDQKQVQDVYFEAMTVGASAPLPVAMREVWTDPVLALPLYLISFLSLSAYVLLDSEIAGHIAFGVVTLSALFLTSYRQYLSYIFKEYTRGLFNEDLGNIAQHYSTDYLQEDAIKQTEGPMSGFWVAEVYGSDMSPRIVGTVSLDIGTTPDPTVGELRRMVVSPQCQRQGVAHKLLTALVGHAKAHDIKEVFLATSAWQLEAVMMYKRRGWRETSVWRNRWLLSYTKMYDLRLDVGEFKE
ncbi:acyl-CoA N-acyltransferase [Panaeolus papilionaceus]|nr:acyl-CoA N-acyltransferase [Panaeolus papilionaceus]